MDLYLVRHVGAIVSPFTRVFPGGPSLLALLQMSPARQRAMATGLARPALESPAGGLLGGHVPSLPCAAPLFPPPPAVAALLVRRGYLPPHTPLLKPLAALPGTTVCVHGQGVVIQGIWMAPVAAADTQGRPLPRWRGCVTLGPAEVFPLSLAPRSFDGRYFGPVAVADLLGQAFPVWTWGAWEAGSGTGERGQDKGTPGEATLPKKNQALGTRQAPFLPVDNRHVLPFQTLAPRHHVVPGEE
ncbi:MAG: S26 family signal peptidase [Candidatus Tectimicrobiota bacterium]